MGGSLAGYLMQTGAQYSGAGSNANPSWLSSLLANQSNNKTDDQTPESGPTTYNKFMNIGTTPQYSLMNQSPYDSNTTRLRGSLLNQYMGGR